MAPQPEPQDTETVVDSYPTSDEAWKQAHVFAQMLRDRGLAAAMGVTVKRAGHVYWIVLVKRG